MNMDIKTIKLCRKSIIKNNKSTNTEQTNEEQLYFSTDYFNQLCIEDRNEFCSLSELSEIWREDTREDEIAVQRYVIYCNDNVIHQYEIHDRKYGHDPFEISSEMNYLSMIQVYITPEVLAAMNQNANSVWSNGEKIVMRPFLQDIYDTLDLFNNDNPDITFVARVYTMLSAGDFAIIVRSKQAETSYKISTYLRKRKATVPGKETTLSRQLVLYKTYTLLTLGNQIIQTEKETNEDESQNVIVIRGCYSNKYWSEQSKIIQDWGTNINALTEIHHLNGRYDFSLRVKPTDFQKLMPHISDPDRKTETKKETVIDYLIYLLKNEYLSYVNERYLLDINQDYKSKDENFISKTIYLNPNYTGNASYFRDTVDTEITQLKQIWESMEKKLHPLYLYRKKLRQYFFLIKKLIESCRSINGLSDTRIYAKGLAEQLKVVLETAQLYLYYYEDEKAGDILDLLESYMQKAVFALDSYAGYIRNNNLQSLQTPNYNLQSSMSMEKFLIGYSELLWELMEDYHIKAKAAAGNKTFLPVVIPDLHDLDVNVEILFPAGNGNDYDKEERFKQEKKLHRYLMVVAGVTMMELTDMPVMICALCHEFAHQFHYEKEAERHHIILDIMIKEYMQGIAANIIANIIRKIGAESDATGTLHEILATSFKKAYEDVMKKDSEKYDRMSLEYIKREAESDLQKLFLAWTTKKNLRERIKEYFNELRYDTLLERSAIEDKLQQVMSKLDELENAYNSGIDSTDENKLRQEIAAPLFELAQIYAYNNLNDNDKARVNQNRKTLTNQAGKSTYWDSLFQGINNMNTARIKRSYIAFELWLNNYINDMKQTATISNGTVEVFGKKIYNYAQSMWSIYSAKSKMLYNMNDSLTPAPEEINHIPEYRY